MPRRPPLLPPPHERAVDDGSHGAATKCLPVDYQNGSNSSSTPGSYEAMVQSQNPLLFFPMNDPGLVVNPSLNAIAETWNAVGTAGSATTPNYGSLGSANNGNYTPGTQVVPGPGFSGFGPNHTAVNFSGLGYISGIFTNTGLWIPSMPGIVTSNFSFTCWVYQRSPVQYGNPYFSQRGSGYCELWANNHDNPNAKQLSTLWTGAPTNGVIADYGYEWPGALLPATNLWNFVAAVWTGTNCTIYINGASSVWQTNIAATATGTSTNYPRDFGAGGPLWLGGEAPQAIPALPALTS